MKTLCTLVFAALAFTGHAQSPADPARELAMEVAKASGIEHWPQVRSVRFTFNAQLPDRTVQRTWVWHPPTQEVEQIGTEGATLRWKRGELSQASDEVKKADAAFINDSYWLLFPFRMVWDAGRTLTLHEGEHDFPAGTGRGQKLTVTYNGSDGYTPGDAYDLFIGPDRRIAAWAFRKGNAPTPTRVSTWEDYRELGGLVIAHDHRGPEGFRVWFTDVRVE